MMNEAKNFWERAGESYEEGKKFMEENKYPQAVDKFHDVVENSLKALFNLYDISYPPHHDILNLMPQIIEKIPKNDPNFNLYSETVLPPFLAIHAALKSIRNMTRYGYQGISANKIINKEIAESISLMLKTNYPILEIWITRMVFKE